MRVVALKDFPEFRIIAGHIYDVSIDSLKNIHIITKNSCILFTNQDLVMNFKLLNNEPNQNFRTSFFKRIFKSFSWGKR